MKKRYKTPECKAVHLEMVSFLANSYSNDQGNIVIDPSLVDAGDSD